MKRARIPGVIPQEQHVGSSVHTLIKIAVLISILFDYVIQTRRNTEIGLYYAEHL